ncbi:unnamed protein product [Mytilus coruscus]|uniref:Uncharacterized protein n=1 Tax=Mytilus coruscus TaxID=42192 RepID=A0A6J8DB45_MYTCO|nr:unnamed protein product [Mytilus coruscus]
MWTSVTIFILIQFVRLELSPNFEKCFKDFFYQETVPTLKGQSNSTQICQLLGNKYYYATNYDTNNRIPYYSAYRLSFDNCGKRYNKWFIEPQLAGKDNPNMALAKNKNATIYGSEQAVDNDYTNSSFDRGHLNPQMYHCETNNSRKATNTLTNIAPQNHIFNNIIWQKLENILYNISKTYCDFAGARRYFITGVLSETNRSISNGRVKVPTHYWTAVCCDSSGVNDTIRSEGWSAGFLGENANNSLIYINEIENFLANYTPRLFTDYKDQNGNIIKNCLFNSTKAFNIIDEIAATDPRFIKPIKESLTKRIFNAVYNFRSYILDKLIFSPRTDL